MTITRTREAHGDAVHYVSTFELPQEWRQYRPPTHLLSSEVNAAWNEYARLDQERARLDQERRHLHTLEAEAEALQADERAAATRQPGEPVETASLDDLARRRTANLVARGGIAHALEAVVDRLNNLRFAPDHAALNPGAGPAADKARARALQLLAELGPLVEQVPAWTSARRWTQGEPFRPDLGLRGLVEEIRYALSDTDGEGNSNG